MEARHSLSSLRGQGYAFFRPGARNSRHHTKDVGAAVEKHGGRRHCESHRISPSSTEGGIPVDQMGTVSLSSAGCNPEMGRSTPEKLRGHDDRSRVTSNSEVTERSLWKVRDTNWLKHSRITWQMAGGPGVKP